MIVAELIEWLRTVPQDAKVCVDATEPAKAWRHEQGAMASVTNVVVINDIV